MRKITLGIATTIVLGAFAIALPKLKSEVKANPAAVPAAPQLGKKACKNVKFKFTNNRSDQATIRIEKVSYNLVGVGNKTELVRTTNDCRYGQTCITTGDNLPDADGRSITNIQLVYKYLPKTVGANWSGLVQTPHQPNVANPVCSDNKTYGDGSKGFYIPPQ
ncbi:MAG TPA: hypothetical protein VIM99_16635 [Blastocatellia bacterium]